MRTTMIGLAGALAIGTTLLGAADAENERSDARPPGGEQRRDAAVQIGLIGDLLYFEHQVDDLRRLVEDMQDADLDLTIHDGDITFAPVDRFRCSEAVLRYHQDNVFNALGHPVIYTPGDNEWTDCPLYVDRFGAENLGTSNPLEALDNIRRLFFDRPTTLGRNPLPMKVQSRRFPENRRLTFAGIPIATLHVVGSLNGYSVVRLAPALAEEILARQRANLQWLRRTFKEAEHTDAPGVMLVWHGNPDPYTRGMWEADAQRPALWEDAYKELLAELRTQVQAFGKPVVLVYGDSHFFRVDKPLAIKSGSDFSLTNFTRVETFGEPNHHWVRATIDPSDPQVFKFEPVIVEGNRRPGEETE